MAFDANQIRDPLIDHALELGVFDRVNAHEPANAPGNGLTYALWLDAWQTLRASGLNSVSIRITFSGRVFTPLNAQPADDLDTLELGAVSLLMSAYCGDFQLGAPDDVRSIDIFGAAGQPLSAQAGYVEQDGMQYRVTTLTIPVIVNDAWTEAP